jgi:hypothetical protein
MGCYHVQVLQRTTNRLHVDSAPVYGCPYLYQFLAVSNSGKKVTVLTKPKLLQKLGANQMVLAVR